MNFDAWIKGKLKETVWRLAVGSCSTAQDRSLVGCYQRFAIESGLCPGRVLGEEIQEEDLGFFALAFGGLKEAANSGVVFQTVGT